MCYLELHFLCTEAKNSYVHVDVDLATDFIFCIQENSEHENSSCIIKAIFELQGETCNSDRWEDSTYAYQNLTSSNVSIAHLPRSQLFCFVAEVNNSTSTVILMGQFSTPIGSTQVNSMYSALINLLLMTI